MLPFLNNVNEEVSSYHKDEVATMMDAVPNISDLATHFASHRLRANAQFSDIEKIMQSMKKYPFIIYMVPDNNKNCR